MKPWRLGKLLSRKGDARFQDLPFYADSWTPCTLPFFANHAVILVGWNDAETVWYLKNSWGEGWGESGYMKIGYGVSYVGFTTTRVLYEGKIDMLYTTVWREDGAYSIPTPIVRGEPLWSLATDWQGPVPFSTLPGTGAINGQSDVVIP